MNDAQVSIVQYADDFCVYTEHKKYNIAIDLLTSSITNLGKWFSLNGFELSANKSTVVVFSRHNCPNITNINLGNYHTC